MTISPRTLFLVTLALGWANATVAAAQPPAWVVEVRPSAGSLAADVAQPVVEAASGRISRCTDGPGPHRFAFAMSLRPNGQVREAALDRGATTDPRAGRCIRHVLLGLHFPAHEEAATLVLTLSAGEFGADAPSAPGPIAPGPIASPPTSSSSPSPLPHPIDASGEVTIGAVEATADRTAAQILSVVAPQRSALAACYATARAADAALAGDATLHLGISAEGRVTSAMFQAPEALASALALCVGQAARTWTFGATAAEAQISVPLTFGSARPVRR